MHPAMPMNPILVPRSVDDGKASFRQEYHKLMLDRGGLMPPNPSYVNPTLSNKSSGHTVGVSFRKEYRLMQMDSQGLNPPKHEEGYDYR